MAFRGSSLVFPTVSIRPRVYRSVYDISNRNTTNAESNIAMFLDVSLLTPVKGPCPNHEDAHCEAGG